LITLTLCCPQAPKRASCVRPAFMPANNKRILA
jgi:hypothetical protein